MELPAMQLWLRTTRLFQLLVVQTPRLHSSSPFRIHGLKTKTRFPRFTLPLDNNRRPSSSPKYTPKTQCAPSSPPSSPSQAQHPPNSASSTTCSAGMTVTVTTTNNSANKTSPAIPPYTNTTTSHVRSFPPLPYFFLSYLFRNTGYVIDKAGGSFCRVLALVDLDANFGPAYCDKYLCPDTLGKEPF